MYVVGDVATPFVNRPAGQDPDAPAENELSTSSVASVKLPDITANSSGSQFNAPVQTSLIDSRDNLVGFQGDFTFDERVVNFANEPVQKAGLTAGNWTVAGNVLPGPGPIRTLRISAFSNDFVPLMGEGTLFELRITPQEQSNRGGRTPQLRWTAPPNGFIFIDADLNTQRPRE